MSRLYVAGICLALPLMLSAGSAKYLGYRDYRLNGTPEAVVLTDVNKDGIPDAVVGTAGGTEIFLGRGDGSFARPTLIAFASADALAVADFNNDGNPDIAATILTNGTQLTLALGNGDGTFQAPQVLPIGCIDCFLAAADFNGDGNMDLAVASTATINVYLGQGDGTFITGSPTFFTEFSVAATAGDLNGDGIPDLVVTDFGPATVIVLIGDGKGAFTRTDYAAGIAPFETVLTDLNHDGRLDMAVPDRDSGTILVYLNQGDGVFAPAVPYPAGCTPSMSCTLEGVAAGDFDGDGKIDLASPGAYLLGNGDGTFQEPKRFHSGDFPSLLSSADLNHDGFADLVIGNSGAVNMSVIMGNSRLWSQLGMQVGSGPRDLALADFDRDGKMDLAVAAAGSNTVDILLGQGDGTFTTGTSLTVQQPGALIAHDLNRDGIVDLAVSSDYGTSIFLGNGDGTFRAGAQYPTFYGDCTFNAIQQTAAPCFAAADFNGDGVPDLVGALWIANTVSFLMGNGDGTYTPGPQTLTVTDTPASIAVGDFNHDGKMDVAVSGYFGSVTVFPGNGNGTFGPGIKVTTGSDGGAGIAVGDLDGDGNLDIVLAGGSNSSFISLAVFVITGNGDLTFNPPVAVAADEGPNFVTLGDFDGDGRLDIASANLDAQNVSVLLNQGNLTFNTDILYGTGAAPVVVRHADLNGDGKQDLVVANQQASSISILLHSPK